MNLVPAFFQNTKYVDPEKESLNIVRKLIQKKRDNKTIYDEMTAYISDVVNHKGSIAFNEEWILDKIFSAGSHKSAQISNMIGVYPLLAKTSLFIFTREVTRVLYERGFKDEITELIVNDVLKKVPKLLSKKFKVKKVESNYIIKKK
jgi:hypothetical protein